MPDSYTKFKNKSRNTLEYIFQYIVTFTYVNRHAVALRY